MLVQVKKANKTPIGILCKKTSQYTCRELLYFIMFCVPLGIYFYINWPALQEGMFATGDWAVLSTMTRRAQSFEQLLGNYSRFGWSHLGPTVFYLVGFFSSLTAQFAEPEIVAVFCYESLFFYMSYRMFIRFYGFPNALLLVAVAWLMIICIRIMTPEELINQIFFIYWVPVMTVMPMLLFIISFTVVSSGERHALIPLAFSSAILPQLHIGTSYHALFFLILSLILYVRKNRLEKGVGIKDVFKAHIKVSAFFVMIFAAVWCLPIYEAMANGGGNLFKVFDFFLNNSSSIDGSVDLSDALGFLLTFYMLPFRALFSLFNIGHSYYALLYILSLIFLLFFLRFGWVSIGKQFRIVMLMIGLFFVLSVFSAFNIKGEMYPFVMYWQYANVTIFFTMVFIAMCSYAKNRIKKFLPHEYPKGIERAISIAILFTVCVMLSQTPKHTFAAKDTDLSIFKELKNWIGAEGRQIVLKAGELDTWPIVAGIYNAGTDDGLNVCIPDEWLYLYGKASKCSQLPGGELVFYKNLSGDSLKKIIIEREGRLFDFKSNKYGSLYILQKGFHSAPSFNETLTDGSTTVRRRD